MFWFDNKELSLNIEAIECETLKKKKKKKKKRQTLYNIQNFLKKEIKFKSFQKQKHKKQTLVVNLKSPFFHFPLLTYRSLSQSLLSTANMSPMARSATSSVNTSGVYVTLIPFSLHFSRSILSTPTLLLDRISSLGSASIILASAPWPPSPTMARMVAE